MMSIHPCSGAKRGRWSLSYFGPTHRDDICALANALEPCTTVLSAVMIEAMHRTRAAVPLSGVEASCVGRKSHLQHLHLKSRTTSTLQHTNEGAQSSLTAVRHYAVLLVTDDSH